MGVANIVPGISGGGMLLLVGMYTRFIAAIADVVQFRWSLRAFLTIASIGAGAATSIMLLAGPVKWLIINHRWETFSVFIGMRLGAVPMVWKLARPATTSTWVGMLAGLLVTGALATFIYSGGGISSAGLPPWAMFFIGGTVGASATILPGMDGSYILMVLDQYVPILAAVDRFKDALTSADFPAAFSAFLTLLPVALGVAIGLGLVSVLLRRCMTRFPKATFGTLLGIVLGAFIGLYPFADYVPPQPGDVVNGVTLTAEAAAAIPAEDWPQRFFLPSIPQLLGSLALVALGLGAALLLSKLEPEDSVAPRADA